MFKNLGKKGKYVQPDSKEHIGSPEDELRQLVTTTKDEQDRNETLKQAIDRNVEVIDKVSRELVNELFDSAKDLSVPIPPTRQDVIDALRILRSAGGALYKSSTIPYGMEDYSSGGFYPGKTSETSGGIKEHQPTTYGGGELPGPGNIKFENTEDSDSEEDYPAKFIRKNPIPPDIITEDDARYAMDIIKITLPNSTAVQEDVDLMPTFGGDNVNFGDEVFVEDDKVIYVEDPDELSQVKRKPCKTNMNWFLYFLLGVLMSEDETIDLSWVLGRFLLCPLQSLFNTWVMNWKTVIFLIPFVGPILAEAIPYIYAVEEMMYLIAKAKSDQLCGRRLILAKKYSCVLFSEKYFMKGREDDWIANQIVSKLESPETIKLQEATSYQRLLSDNRQIAISLSSYVYEYPQFFKAIDFPSEDLTDSAMDFISEYVSIDYDLLMILGTSVVSEMVSLYEGEQANIEQNQIFSTIASRLIKIFRMNHADMYNGLTPLRRMQKVVNSIMNFRLMESRYYIYSDEEFPRKIVVDGKEEEGYYEDPQT